MEISGIPSGNLLQFAIENGPWVRWFTYQTWGFSIATLVYQRVYHLYHPGNIVYLLTMVKSIIHLYRKKYVSIFWGLGNRHGQSSQNLSSFAMVIWLLVVYLPLWKIMDFVSWEYEIPNWMENQSKFHGSSHHQPVFVDL